MAMFGTLSPEERNLLLAALLRYHGGRIDRAARSSEDHLQDILVKLLASADQLDFAVPEMAAYDLGVLDERIAETERKLARATSEKKREKHRHALRTFQAERDRAVAGPWIRRVLWNMAADEYKVENNRARIIREHAAELLGLYRAGTAESAESVYLRKWQDEDIRARIKRLPEKLAIVAALRYDGWSYDEIAHVLGGISVTTVYKRAERIRSPRIRQALGLPC
jgi:DNA-directed RNA polymerase specialized sigma24 family protein